MANAQLTDWRKIEDEREKYAAYLCSREWAVLKEAVHERAKEICERCKIWPIDAVHHLSYERKYKERLEDLRGDCKWCHEFTHGKGEWDFADRHRDLGRYIEFCLKANKAPQPGVVMYGKVRLRASLALLMHAVESLEGIQRLAKRTGLPAGKCASDDPVELAIRELTKGLPFAIFAELGECLVTKKNSMEEYDRACQELGCRLIDAATLIAPALSSEAKT
jgi:hypothetical protein